MGCVTLAQAMQELEEEMRKAQDHFQSHHYYELVNSLNRIERKAWVAKLEIFDIVDFAG